MTKSSEKCHECLIGKEEVARGSEERKVKERRNDEGGERREVNG